MESYTYSERQTDLRDTEFILPSNPNLSRVRTKMTACVIPTFRASNTIISVVIAALEYCDLVIVIDDACPNRCGEEVAKVFKENPRVLSFTNPVNLGVGGATKLGMQIALDHDADFILKIDADGQMDPSFIPSMIYVLEKNPKISLVKGNRFYDNSITRLMPGVRLAGNSALTLLVRLATGYWSGIDPTNGYFLIRATTARRLQVSHLASRYYFEISLLVELALKRANIAEMEMPARYSDEISGLSVWKVMLTFPFKLVKSFTRRVLWQYIISDMNAGSIFIIIGILFSLIGSTTGIICWIQALTSGTPRTAGTVTIILFLIIIGFQLLLNALLYDVQFSPSILKVSCHDLPKNDAIGKI